MATDISSDDDFIAKMSWHWQMILHALLTIL